MEPWNPAVKSAMHGWEKRRGKIMLEKIKIMIAEQLGIDAEEIKPESSLQDDLSADSLDLFELVMAFEEEYDIEIPSENLEGIETVGDIIKLMKDNGVEE